MDEKQAVTSIFNLVAELYDNPSLRFFPATAARMVEHANITPGNKVLDIATGTGMVAIAASKAINDDQLHAIDLSENMLEQAKQNMQRAGLSNIEFQVMDGEELTFEDNSFDVITCSYGLFFMPDMQAALKSWLKALKPGGKLIFSSFAPSAFTPMSDIFIEHLAEYDVTPPTPRWLQLAEEDKCIRLLEEAGFENAEVMTDQMGYHLDTVNDWWQSIQSAGYRGLYEQLAEDVRDEFKNKHLAAIEKLRTGDGIWLDVKTLFTTANKPV